MPVDPSSTGRPIPGDEVDRLIDERPGKVLLTPVYDQVAVRINDFIYKSGGASASYMVLTDGGRVVINAGQGWEAPHHRRLFDAICPGPTSYILTTQGHVDHVGGVAAFREPATIYVAQADNPSVQADDTRIEAKGWAWASVWFGRDPDLVAAFAAARPDVPHIQDRPSPDILFDQRLGLTVGATRFELIAAVGETTDSAVVWLPEHAICFVSNLLGPLFPHFPNLNTLRGQKYRFVEPYLETIRMLRGLQPEMLITGRGDPIVGRDLIDRALDRLYGAVDYVHRETLRGINAGADLDVLMREIRLPAELRVGEGYGKVSWGVRTIWETYLGWFKHESTAELYPRPIRSLYPDLARLAGADQLVALAWTKLSEGRAVEAIQLAEIALSSAANQEGAAEVMVEAHQMLLASGGDTNFWESGWLRHQTEKWSAVAAAATVGPIGLEDERE